MLLKIEITFTALFYIKNTLAYGIVGYTTRNAIRFLLSTYLCKIGQVDTPRRLTTTLALPAVCSIFSA